MAGGVPRVVALGLSLNGGVCCTPEAPMQFTDAVAVAETRRRRPPVSARQPSSRMNEPHRKRIYALAMLGKFLSGREADVQIRASQGEQ